jgi:hypothetical protein
VLVRPDRFSPDQFSLVEFLAAPDLAIVNVLLLQFQPAFLDILPLYIVLLSLFPGMLYVIGRSPLAALVISGAVYAAAQVFGWQLHGFPGDRVWFLNPFAWQFLFVIGATMGSTWGRPVSFLGTAWFGRFALTLAGICAVISLTWTVHNVVDDFPGLLWNTLGPAAGDKTNLNPLRLVNFLALTAVVVHFVRHDSAFLHRRAAAPLIACGQNSLEVFCFGILLSVLGHCALVMLGADWPMQLAVSVVGCALMLGLGQLLHWYKLDDRSHHSAPAVPGPARPR